MEFTNDMNFPDNMADLINKDISVKVFDILMLNGETEEID